MASAPPYELQNEVLKRYDISGIFAKELEKITLFKCVIICDDSTSMREKLNGGQTKWDELKQSVQAIIDILNSYTVDCDVLFLNRPGMRNVRSFNDLNEQFSTLPYGSTPLTKCLQMAINSNRVELNERKLLILVFTDGCPTSDVHGNEDAIREFRNELMSRNPINKIFVTIVACTDDDYSLSYLNNWDKEIPNLDVVDDFKSEQKEIYKAGKLKQPFSYGDYMAKILLGSHVKEIDELDERPSLFIGRLNDFIIVIVSLVFFFIIMSNFSS